MLYNDSDEKLREYTNLKQKADVLDNTYRDFIESYENYIKKYYDDKAFIIPGCLRPLTLKNIASAFVDFIYDN